MKKMKFIRVFSGLGAIFSLTTWIIEVINWLVLMYGGYRRDFESFGYMMEVMFFAYDVILHWSIQPINIAIIVKEIVLEFKHVIRKKRG